MAAMAMVSTSAFAQFHQNKSGQTGVSKQAVTTAQQQAAAMSSQGGITQGGNAQLGTNALSTIYVSEAHKRAYGARLGEQETKIIHVWGRAIHHSDGTYTESKQDELTNTLEQITKSENGTKLQRRMVMLDARGRPEEIMIYDGRDKFKYRGVHLYDTLGRFSEEQLYDAEGTLIRRKVQEYSPTGSKLPVRSWDYVENVPEDLKLVITRESEDPTSNRNSEPQKQERRGLFGNRKEEPKASQAGQPGETTPPAVSEEKRKTLNLPRFFGGKRQK